MEEALEARAAMTDEDEETKGDDGSVDLDGELKQLDTEEEDDVGLTEEEDDEDDDKTKSPAKAKKKRLATDDEGDEDDEDEEMKDETADEEDDEPEDFEEEDAEEEDEEPSDGSKLDLADPKSMLRMIRSLPEREAKRHEHFRRAHFDRGAIKRIMAKTIAECATPDRRTPTVTQVMSIIMAGMTKSFVGALTAEARRIMDRNGETGPIEPRHLREAQRKYYKRRPLARGRNRRRLLR